LRIGTSPTSPRAQRATCRLASVPVAAAASSISAATCGETLVVPIQASALAASATRLITSAAVSSPSHPGPTTVSSGRSPSASVTVAASITASQSGLASCGSSPRAMMSPPTSARRTRSQPSASQAEPIPSAMPAVPPLTSMRTVSVPRCAAIRDSENGTPSGVVVPAEASTALAPSARPPSIWATGRGPGWGSIGIRSQATPPSANGVPSASQKRATASAPTTSPPPPAPMTSALSAPETIE
jgi:hypothetical protein